MGSVLYETEILSSGSACDLTQVHAGACVLEAIEVTNVNAAVCYLKIYDALSAGVTVGTTAVTKRHMVPGSTAGSGIYLRLPRPLPLAAGLTVAITTGVGDAEETSVAANEVIAHLYYSYHT